VKQQTLDLSCIEIYEASPLRGAAPETYRDEPKITDELVLSAVSGSKIARDRATHCPGMEMGVAAIFVLHQSLSLDKQLADMVVRPPISREGRGRNLAVKLVAGRT